MCLKQNHEDYVRFIVPCIKNARANDAGEPEILMEGECKQNIGPGTSVTITHVGTKCLFYKPNHRCPIITIDDSLGADIEYHQATDGDSFSAGITLRKVFMRCNPYIQVEGTVDSMLSDKTRLCLKVNFTEDQLEGDRWGEYKDIALNCRLKFRAITYVVLRFYYLLNPCTSSSDDPQLFCKTFEAVRTTPLSAPPSSTSSATTSSTPSANSSFSFDYVPIAVVALILFTSVVVAMVIWYRARCSTTETQRGYRGHTRGLDTLCCLRQQATDQLRNNSRQETEMIEVMPELNGNEPDYRGRCPIERVDCCITSV
ncbi:uncharacterized protein LOC128217383 isoform X3 [Mya arenaria]|uniref:uncharacterized protein LOC128217383 isoform X3 n=1 Tax=Mya arenaria TaxID=6604 RepID=UPI0022DFA8D4|nr:uncharacterized protein LOC128217383 isoform X3 [Mya arenaria]